MKGNYTMKLSQLAQASAPYFVSLSADCEIHTLTQDSREKTQLGLFFCISGQNSDAHDFVPQALSNGAVALVVTRLLDVDVPQVVVTNDRAAMALMAAAFFGNPAHGMRMVGVTGTKGKTTTTYFLKAILEAAGANCGLIGTTGSMIGNHWMRSRFTTPDPIELHSTLRAMADAGVEVLCMEASAHAISMHRLEGISFEAACYLNLSQDHLDYYGSMDRYFEAKKSLFTGGGVRNAALNADDDTTPRIVKDLRVPHSTFGICTNADIFARHIEIHENGVNFQLSLWNEQVYPLSLRMMGMFNVYNALAATATALILGIAPDTICRGLESVRTVPGRAEVLDTNTPYKVILDYSHSPDAMENILRTARDFTRGRLIVVFGCGGDRDHLKRPKMGAIAGRLADFSILTSDNPRTEDPMAILDQVEQGIAGVTDNFAVIENRRDAIRLALEMGQDGDVVILAGKGHETYQDIGGVKRPFEEKQIVRELLAAAMKRE